MNQAESRCFAILCIFVCGVTSAIGAQSGDPAIGSYYYFAALDRKCSERDAIREAALEKFKQHEIKTSRSMIIKMLPSSVAPEASKEIDDLERNGPAIEKLSYFDSFFAKGTPQEIQTLCLSATRDIEERMAMERKMIEAFDRAKPAFEETKSK